MKTQFLFTIFVANGLMMSVDAKHIFPNYPIAFVLWGLFFLRAYNRNKRIEGYRHRAYIRDQYYRSWLDKNGYRY